ncbi:hypothetical protein EV360DRAFT_71954 [Lentinula raphanica]|nr:hypothetical protein EV360DRAFT_71954 [Lentinula raphanica]
MQRTLLPYTLQNVVIILDKLHVPILSHQFMFKLRSNILHQQNHPVSGDSRDTPQILSNLRDLGGIPGVSRDRHQYYTPESAGIPVRAAPGQFNLANELELADELPSVQRSSAAPTQGQELLADLVATERRVFPLNRQTLWMSPLLAESTPAVHDTNTCRSPTFHIYSEGYREVMGKSPPAHHTSPRVAPDTHIRSLAARQQVDNSPFQNELLNLVGPAHSLLNALGFHTKGRTNVGILRLLQQIVRLTDDEVTPELMCNLSPAAWQ